MREDQKAVFNSLRPRLIRACRGYLGALQLEAEDLVQDACHLAGPKLDVNAPLDETVMWLQQICLQLCGARRRSREGIVRCLEGELERARRNQDIERVDSDDLEAQKQQWIGLLQDAIKPLSLQGRQMLQLRNVKGLTYAQIGATLELSWSAVAARLDDAREEMSASIGPEPVSSLTQGPWASRAL